MKRILIIAILLSCSAVWAQDVVRDSVLAKPVADSADVEENVIGAKPSQHVKQQPREANVLGAPVYYDTNGNIRGSKNPSPYYQRPKHHYLNNLEERFCSFFAEGKWFHGGEDWGIGLNLTYLPERWGGYCSLMTGHANYVSAGPTLRLSDYESTLDWQLYGGLMSDYHSVGAEVGLRIAAPQYTSNFCWTSATIGAAILGDRPFFTFGASFGIIGAVGLTAFLLY